MPNKQEELLRCDYDFLYTLTKEVNLAYRNYDSPSKSYLINLLSSKFNSKAIKEIVDLYMLCFDAEYVANIKVFGINLKEGSGAEISPDNLKSNEVLVPNVPSELVYGLWSVAVGKHVFGTSLSYSQHPIYFEQAYVHLPDFNKKETIEILAYSALNVLIKNYAEDRIGFFGSNRVFKFGDERLTKSVEYLFSVCKNCCVYNNLTLDNVFEQIQQSKLDKEKCRKGIKDKVSKRLTQIGYWDYVPIPSNIPALIQTHVHNPS